MNPDDDKTPKAPKTPKLEITKPEPKAPKRQTAFAANRVFVHKEIRVGATLYQAGGFYLVTNEATLELLLSQGGELEGDMRKRLTLEAQEAEKAMKKSTSKPKTLDNNAGKLERRDARKKKRAALVQKQTLDEKSSKLERRDVRRALSAKEESKDV